MKYILILGAFFAGFSVHAEMPNEISYFHDVIICKGDLVKETLYFDNYIHDYTIDNCVSREGVELEQCRPVLYLAKTHNDFPDFGKYCSGELSPPRQEK